MPINPNGNPAAAVSALDPAPAPALVGASLLKRGKLLRLPAVEDRTALKKSTIYAGIKAGTFPSPVRLSARAVGFFEDDIDRWVSERVATAGRA